ncbi:MAG: hypothetical protein JW709_12125 [Sedimentisphaerales bacterium]|nr:hypothetical protein [Sedimentisphaerales bacterium]
MMQLLTQCIPDWPKLAWVAGIARGDNTVTVRHGPCVEIGPQWCCEAVWAGDFQEGDFDQTDLVFGTGIRVRENQVIFVSSGTMEDRLWHCVQDDVLYVSNTLGGFLATTGLTLREDYFYPKDIMTVCGGLSAYVRTLPTATRNINLTYFHNLAYNNGDVAEKEKPDTAPRLLTFSDYYNFLAATAEKLGKNLRDSQRRHQVVPLTTISRGYDASATAVISRYAQCRNSVTIKQSSSLWRGSDSGADIAQHLNLFCKTCNRTAKKYPLEETIWSVNGRAGVLNWTLFDYPEPLCLLFTGSYGDGVWDRRRIQLPDPFASAAAGLAGLSEFRLFQGIFNCPVPFWGRRHFNEVQNISFSQEMEPWTLYNDYDRPVPRRIVEEAGVPRDAFGKRKKNTSLETPFLWPYSPQARAGFRTYLKERNLYAPSNTVLAIMRQGNYVNSMIYTNLTKRLGWSNLGERLLRLQANFLLFHWANHELRLRYEDVRSQNNSSLEAFSKGKIR